jgi:hypothetical protein
MEMACPATFLPRDKWRKVAHGQSSMVDFGIGSRTARIEGFQTDVVEIVAVKASRNIEDQQHSTWLPQSIQSKAVIFTRFQQRSISA